MSGANLTEERLRTWLDGNQLARERLCVQLLSLDRRFRQVHSRQPKGGPDEGYDLEAVLEDGRAVVGAIGFRNSPTDSAADQRWVREKFQHDLQRAKASADTFQLFIFFTNVRLTVGVHQKLLVLGKSLVDVDIEIVHRELMRLSLDSPEGLAARYQYLQIPLSETEQAAFFARWGGELSSLLTTSFAAVEERLHRLEFLHERDRPLVALAFRIRLRAPTAIVDLPHVRAFLSLARIRRNSRRSQWHVGVCNNSPTRNAPNCGVGPCLAGAFWLQHADKPHSTKAWTWPDPYDMIAAQGGFNEFSDPKVVSTLADIDNGLFAFFMNRRLFDRIAGIHLYANEYLIWSTSADQLHGDNPNSEPETPWRFAADELADPWVRVMPKDYRGSLQFSSSTPRRLWDAPRLRLPG
jgi:hypothetical protein